MTFGELLGAVLGWIGELVEWMIGWVPRYAIIRSDEVGVRQYVGTMPEQLDPGMHWYVPNLTEIDTHHSSRMVLDVPDMSLETKDGIACQIGMVVTYHITDVLVYATENVEAEASMSELAQAALRDAVMEHTWADLLKPTEDGRMLEKKLSTRLQRSLDRFGVEVESCRPTDQVRLRAAQRLFGLQQIVSIGS